MYKRLSIDTVRRTITLIDSDSGQENQPLELNRSEYNLLLAFCESHGEVIDKQVLIDKGWPGRVVGDNSLAVAIMKLRKKLDSLELGIEVNNLPGEGYVFINALSIDIVYDESGTIPDTLTVNKEEKPDLTIVPENSSPTIGSVLPEKAIDGKYDSARWYKKPVIWELVLALVVGCTTFYFLYREAFECFECFGG